MCGITGFWLTRSALHGSPDPRSVLRLMSDAIAHRGPDDSDHSFDARYGVGLGHRRLSINDLSPEGRQPMVSASGRFTIVFNGEVYNFKAIADELQRAGVGAHYRGGSDTEVMLAAIEAWGVEETLERFVGMFAFALWDAEQGTLSLVRDRLGVKPLYYCFSPLGLLFGSELKALLAFPGFEPEVDHESVSAFLRWGYVPAPSSIYAGVSKLEPGCLLRVTGPEPAAAKLERYWDAHRVVEAGSQRPLSDGGALEELDRVLQSAVALRMIADVPIGALLSGGIDSSLVVALMQAQSSRKIRTFSIGNPSADYDESRQAARVATHLGTDHTSFIVTSKDALSVVPELGDLYDEPFADSSQIPTLLVSRLARKQVTVALTGDGGDEVFAGYNRYIWAPRLWAAMRLVPTRLRTRIRRWLLAITPYRYDGALRRLLPAKSLPRQLGSKLHKAFGVLGAESSDALYRALCSQWQGGEEVLQRSFSERARAPAGTGSFVSDMMLMDLITYLPDDVLTKVDRATMSVALEARAPFLDHRVVELGWRLPIHTKIRGDVSKWPLRQLLYRHVPRDLVDRPKMGFAVPVSEWLRGPLRDWAEDQLRLDRVREQPYFQPETVAATWQEHLSGSRDHGARLWTLLMLQAWLNGSNGPNRSKPVLRS